MIVVGPVGVNVGVSLLMLAGRDGPFGDWVVVAVAVTVRITGGAVLVMVTTCSWAVVSAERSVISANLGNILLSS